VVPYCRNRGGRGKFGLGAWLRQRAHVQPAPRRFGKRDEKVGFNMAIGGCVSLQVSAQPLHKGVGFSKQVHLEAKSEDVAAAAATTPAGNF
jgi:hypothetical protein